MSFLAPALILLLLAGVSLGGMMEAGDADSSDQDEDADVEEEHSEPVGQSADTTNADESDAQQGVNDTEYNSAEESTNPLIVALNAANSLQVDYVDVGDEVAPMELFGGNILAPRVEMEGPGGYNELIEDLGVTDLRYPGGSLTEQFFRIEDPDSNFVTDPVTGATKEFVPISDFLSSASALGRGVTIVVPTKFFLGDELDENGNRTPEFNENKLRDFVFDVVTGAYGVADITAFEIGNEYWGSGEMNAAEYGMLASQMVEFIADEIQLATKATGEEYDIDIVVQMGTNYGSSDLTDQYVGWDQFDALEDISQRFGIEFDASAYWSSGDVNWPAVNNIILISQLSENALDQIDGVVAHVYSKEPAVPGQRDFHLSIIDQTWLTVADELDVYVTEWNSSGATSLFDRHEDYGLYQAAEIIELVEEFVERGVDVAHAWPLLQNSPNAFSLGFEHDSLTPSGEMFRLLAEVVPGKAVVDFDAMSQQTEAVFEGADLHAFYGDGEMVFYLVSTSNSIEYIELNISGLITDFDSLDARTLGVKDGDLIGSNASTAEITLHQESEVFEDGVLMAILAPGEIMQIRISRVSGSPQFLSALN